MPVLIMSQRRAARPGIIALNSMRTYSGVRQSRRAISLPSSMRMPCSWPCALTNCSGGRVGLVDMVRVRGLTSSESGTRGVQAGAWAKAGVAAMAAMRGAAEDDAWSRISLFATSGGLAGAFGQQAQCLAARRPAPACRRRAAAGVAGADRPSACPSAGTPPWCRRRSAARRPRAAAAPACGRAPAPLSMSLSKAAAWNISVREPRREVAEHTATQPIAPSQALS